MLCKAVVLKLIQTFSINIYESMLGPGQTIHAEKLQQDMESRTISFQSSKTLYSGIIV